MKDGAHDNYAERELDALLSGRTWRPAPPEVEEALRGQLDAFRRRLSETERARKRGFVEVLVDLAAQPYLRPALAVAALLAVVVAAFLVVRVATHDAYASVARQLRASESISYTIEVAEGVHVDIAHMEPGLYRLATSWGVEMVENRVDGHRTLLIHFDKRYRVEPLEGPQEHADVREEVDAFLDAVKSLPDKADEVVGERVLDGRVTVGHSVVVQGQQMIFWIDRETDQPRQVDIVIKQGEVSVHVMHIRDIRIDGALDPALFEIEIPEDYTEIQRGEGEADNGHPVPGE